MEDITFGGPDMPMYHDLPDFVFEHPEVKALEGLTLFLQRFKRLKNSMVLPLVCVISVMRAWKIFV